MATPTKDRIRAAALAYPALSALIGANWYDTQLPQTATFPAVVIQQITGPRVYVLTGRLNTYWARMQFTIWGGQFSAGAEARDSVFSALAAFLDQLNLIGIAGMAQYPNFVVGDRDFLFVQTDGPIFQKVVDAMMFINESL